MCVVTNAPAMAREAETRRAATAEAQASRERIDGIIDTMLDEQFEAAKARVLGDSPIASALRHANPRPSSMLKAMITYEEEHGAP